jgi:hypothetical protein
MAGGHMSLCDDTTKMAKMSKRNQLECIYGTITEMTNCVG